MFHVKHQLFTVLRETLVSVCFTWNIFFYVLCGTSVSRCFMWNIELFYVSCKAL